MQKATATRLALIAACALSFPPAQAIAQAQGTRGGSLIGMFSTFAKPDPASISTEMKTGRPRPAKRFINLEGTAIELEPDATVEGDFSQPNTYYSDRSMPVVQYIAYIRTGETLTARAVSTDGHLMIVYGTEPGAANLGVSATPSPTGPKLALLSHTAKKDRLVYITVAGMLPKTDGGFYSTRYAPVGRFTLQLGDPNRPFAPPTRYTEAPSAPAPAPQAAAANSLEATYASLCAANTGPETETCAALRKAMVAKLSAPPTSTAAAAPKVVAPQPAPASRRGRGRPVAAAIEAEAPVPTQLQRPPVDPVRWAAAESAVAMRPTPFTQALEMPYGKNARLDVKLPAGQGIEVLIDMPDGSGTANLCLRGQPCIAAILTNETATFRLRPGTASSLDIRVATTSGPADRSYRIRTRGDTNGEGINLLTRIERLAGPPQLIEIADRGLPIKAAMDYLVKEPGRTGTLRVRMETGRTETVEMALDPAGNLAWQQQTFSGIIQPGLDGALNIHYPSGRVGLLIDRDGSFRRIDAARVDAQGQSLPADQGIFQPPHSDVTSTPATERAVLAMLAAGPRRIEAAFAARLLDWGPLAQMAGRSLRAEGGADEPIREYVWVSEGHVLDIKRWAVDGYGIQQPASTSRYTHDATTGRLKVETFAGGKRIGTGEASINRAGALEVRSGSGNDGAVLASTGNGGISETRLTADGGAAAPKRLALFSPADLAAISSRNRQIQQERQEQLAAAEASRKSEGGGFFGFVGKLAQAAAIATNDQAYNAYAMGQLNAAVPGLGDAASAIGVAAGGGNVGVPGVTGVTNGFGGGATGGGSYPTRPNLAATAACSGFTEQNYRQRALAGGPDVQLNTMCGQAFEYYTMYKRAIAQGYAEADANRTYDAHEKSALVANDFYRTAQ